MKTSITELIKAELVSKDFNFPMLTTCKVTRTFVNKDLVQFIGHLLNQAENNEVRELMLLRVKKIILQTPREPNQDELDLRSQDYAQFLIENEKEQRFFEPIKWIDAELDFIRSVKMIYTKDEKVYQVQTKELLDREEMLQVFKFSKVTLNRRIAEGMPAIKIGAKVMFNRQKVYDWLNALP